MLVGAIAGGEASYAWVTQRQGDGGELPLADVLVALKSEIASNPKAVKRTRRKRSKASSKSEPTDIELSAADRKIIWKGRAVVLPGKDADFSENGSGRSASRAFEMD